MSSTDYLVICGRASACSMESARATLESPFDSSKAHHRSTHLPCATLLGAGARYRHLLCTNLGSERKRPGYINRPHPCYEAGPMKLREVGVRVLWLRHRCARSRLGRDQMLSACLSTLHQENPVLLDTRVGCQ